MVSIGVPSLEDLLPLEGQRVLLRADFNVPMHDGVITDDLRIRMAIPTIQSVLDRGGRSLREVHEANPLPRLQERKGVTTLEIRCLSQSGNDPQWLRPRRGGAN